MLFQNKEKVSKRERERSPFKKYIEVDEEKGVVRVLGVELVRNPEPGDLTPKAEQFRDFVEDEFSLKLLQKIAKAVKLGTPLMIEGGQAIGKSKSIEYLAYLTNNEVIRMSLNGQTDTTDLIGKWIPNSGEWRARVEKIYEHPESCKNQEAKKIIKKSKERKEGVGLTREDVIRIAELEGIPVEEGEFVWQDGDMPRQIKTGAWTVLDEVNTCEPQILTRMNSMLESGGRLVIHEDGGRIPEPDDPEKEHALFATLNPPGGRFKGRIPLSSDFISRWTYHNIGNLPEKVAILRENIIAGCSVRGDETKINRMKVEPEGLQDFSLVEKCGEEWVKDFNAKWVKAFFACQEMIENGEIAQDQKQRFDYDQRDRDRFRNYIRVFFESKGIKKVIEDAVEYIILAKLEKKQDREKLKTLVLGLIDVSEPEISDVENESEEFIELTTSILEKLGELGDTDFTKKAKTILEEITSQQLG